MGTLFISYVVLNVVIGLAVVAHHDYIEHGKHKKRVNAFLKSRKGCLMSWLPITVKHDSSPNPNWYPYYPPTVDLNDERFTDSLENDIVAIYYYNCGVRKVKYITSNWQNVIHSDIELVPLGNFTGDKTGHGVLWEDNERRSGESSCKSIVGWWSSKHAEPNSKSDFANKQVNNV